MGGVLFLFEQHAGQLTDTFVAVTLLYETKTLSADCGVKRSLPNEGGKSVEAMDRVRTSRTHNSQVSLSSAAISESENN